MAKHFVATETRLGRCGEAGRKPLPFLQQVVFVGVHLTLEGNRPHFVALGENDAEGYVIFAELVHEVQVYLLDVVTGVDKDEYHFKFL